MSKILVGYIVEDNKPDYKIPFHLKLRYKYGLKLYGFKVFDIASSSEVVIQYSELKNGCLFGLNSEVFKDSKYAHLYQYFYEDMDKDIYIATNNPNSGVYDSPVLPIYNKDLVSIDGWGYEYIGYISDFYGLKINDGCLVYSLLEKEIDLNFSGFSMVHNDFRYLDTGDAYYNSVNEDVDLAWFTGNDIRDLGLVYKFNDVCAAYKFGGDIILPKGCKLLCNCHSEITNNFHKHEYNSIVINSELEYICVSETDEISIDKLYLCKRTYGNIKVVDTFNSVIESYNSIEDLENRLRTIGKELVFY